MKTFISILCGVGVFIGVFWLDAQLINWLVDPLTGNTKYVLKIVLWLVTGSGALGLAIWLGGIAGVLISKLLNRF